MRVGVQMTTKRQHFVPQAYLKGFVEVEGEAFIWAYDKRPGRRPKRDSVKAFAYLNYYYEQETESGEPALDDLEKAFAKTVDSELPSLIRRLKVSPGFTPEITEEERGKIAYFIGLMLTRVPSFRSGVREMYSQIANILISNSDGVDECLIKALESKALLIEAKAWVSLRPMLEVAMCVAQSVLQKNWQFFIASDSVSFLTSDNPVIMGGKNLTGPSDPNAELMIPLRKDLALVCTPHGLKRTEVFKHAPIETRAFNRGVARAANQKVFASYKSDSIERLVKKYSSEHQHFTIS